LQLSIKAAFNNFRQIEPGVPLNGTPPWVPGIQPIFLHMRTFLITTRATV
jgi:hypothetical protein